MKTKRSDRIIRWLLMAAVAVFGALIAWAVLGDVPVPFPTMPNNPNSAIGILGAVVGYIFG